MESPVPVESPVPCPMVPNPRSKRKRGQQDEQLAKHLAGLEERRMELQVKLAQGTDECSRFGQTVADLLRRVPEERRPELMFQVYGLIHNRT